MKHIAHPTFIRSTLSLAVCLSSVAVPVMASDLAVLEKIDLGTLNADGSGQSVVTSLSADGKVGGSVYNGVQIHAVVWSGDGYTTKTDLGSTVRADPMIEKNLWLYSGNTILSHDGKMATSSALGEDNIDSMRAVIWSGENYTTKTDLGTLRADNSNGSAVNALSADGRVVGGWADNDETLLRVWGRAVIWSGENYATKTDLGTLRANNLGNASVNALSADGKIAGGYADNDLNNDFRAVIWSGENYATKTDLGTLRADNSGGSYVFALSSDGKIAGGHADDESNDDRAVIWSGENYATKTDLGTLRVDNLGWSSVNALSSDGKIAGGYAEDGLNDYVRAVIWSGENYATKTDLGTLKADNSGGSAVIALSADGMVAGGWAESDTESTRATLWRLHYPTTTPVVSRIDVENTARTIDQLGADSMALMSMQSHALDRLRHTCHADDGLCVGIQEDISRAKGDDDRHRQDFAVGASVGYGFGNGLSVGVAIDHSASRKLPSSYRHQGDDVGIGAVVRYQADNGVFGEASYAKDDYTATITRPVLANTELGVNEATIKGVSYGAKVGKELATDRTHLRTYVGAKHTDISRGAYTENDDSAFPISYGEMTHKATYATVGANVGVGLTDNVSWVSHAEIAHKVSGDDPVYTASLTGVEKHEFMHQAKSAKTTGQIATGLRVRVSDSTHVEFTPYIKKHDNDQTGYGALFRVEGKFD